MRPTDDVDAARYVTADTGGLAGRVLFTRSTGEPLSEQAAEQLSSLLTQESRS
jgi:hypothetical protein